MEDASGVDLDWFWRGWFYSTDHVDIAIEKVKLFQIESGDPDESAERKRKERDEKEPTLSKRTEHRLAQTNRLAARTEGFLQQPRIRRIRSRRISSQVIPKVSWMDWTPSNGRCCNGRRTSTSSSFRNVGGLVMPIIVRVHYADNTNELVRIPAEIWRRNSQRVDKLFVTDKEIVRFELDPRRETADTEESNNYWPPKLVPSRFKLFKDEKKKNPMQKANGAAEEKKNGKDKEEVEEKEKDDATEKPD